MLPLIERAQREGYELIVSRGGTASLLRKHCTVPVVEIPISGYDIMRTIALLQGYRAPVEVIGFPNVIRGVADVIGLLHAKIPYTLIEHEDEADEALRKARQRGVLIVAGDTVTVRKAEEAGMQGVLISSGRESVLEAFAHAAELYRSWQRGRRFGEQLGKLLDTLNDAVALIDRRGRVVHASARFRQQLERIEHSDSLVHFPELPATLFTSIVGLVGLVDCFNRIATLGEPIRLANNCVFTKAVAVYVGLVEGGEEHSDSRLFYVRIQPDALPARGLDVIWNGESASTGHYPAYSAAEPSFRALATELANQLRRGRWIAVWGERGTGKSLIASAVKAELLQDGEDVEALEIVVRGEEQGLYERLSSMLGSDQAPRLLYTVYGIERLCADDQLALIPLLNRTPCRLIVMFAEDPAQLYKRAMLSGKLWRALSDRIVALSPLRDRPQDVESLVRSLIIQFNEQHGKQIVGVRPDALRLLIERRWKGNMRELYAAVKLLVQAEDGDYIQAATWNEVRHTHEQQWSSGASGGGQPATAAIDLNRPLADIERQIIKRVLNEERFNQSRAAKRLGINRSTLWRKLQASDERDT